MTSRDILNAALLPYKVNMNVVTPLVNKVVATEGGGSSDTLIVHVVGEEGSYIYTADTPVATVWEKVNAGKTVIVEFKETASSSTIKKYYPIITIPSDEEYEKMIYFVYPQ